MKTMTTISKDKKYLCLIGIVTLFAIPLCTAELFTALADMEELLETEAVLIGNLQSYITVQEDKLNYLRK